jgi:hypothetical protein
MDDDTYYNMNLFVEAFGKVNSSEPLATAGCRVRSPIKQVNFTFPFGGFGLILSKGWLRKMATPIFCPRDTDYCHAIQHSNNLGESLFFKNGMTLTDLFHAYATQESFVDYQNWKTGFCLHSDWYVEAEPFDDWIFLFHRLIST